MSYKKISRGFFYIPDGLVVGLLFEGDLAGLGKVLLAKLLLFAENRAPGSMLATFIDSVSFFSIP